MAAVVCTRDRPATLRRALRSLHDQQRSPAEILVIDNGRDRKTRAVAEEFPGVRYLAQPAFGLDSARNRALMATDADIVAFLDDDALAPPEWLARLCSDLDRDPRIAATFGRLAPLSMDTEGARVFEANGGFTGGAERVELPESARHGRLRGKRAPLIAWATGSGSGGNLAVRREAALAIGGFDEALDWAPAIPGGGDIDFAWRLLAAGHAVTCEPRAVVAHEHRPTADAAYAQIIGHQRGLVAFLASRALSSDERRRPEVVAYLLWRLAKPVVRLARRSVGRDPLPASVLLRMWWACITAPFAYLRSKRLILVHAERAVVSP